MRALFITLVSFLRVESKRHLFQAGAEAPLCDLALRRARSSRLRQRSALPVNHMHDLISN